MVLLRIISSNQEQVEEIVKTLLQEKLAIHVTVKNPITEYFLLNGEIQQQTKYIVVAKTKALLFPYIEKVFSLMFPKQRPEMYSLAIVHMDWSQKEKLTEEVKKV
jgi:uncharacterized protein involved in tolerance to divalent cations